MCFESKAKNRLEAALALITLLLSGSLAYPQEIKYTNGQDSWDPDTLGNHRAVVSVSAATRVAKVVIPWRRRDYHPEDKNILVEDAQTHQRILNVSRQNINRESGEVYFEPVSGPGRYYIYYMPYVSGGRSNYPNVNYFKPEHTAAPDWLQLATNTANITPATLVEIQSIDELNSFYPMEVIATAAETRDLIRANANSAFLVFPEDRMHSIRMTNDLPQRWIAAGVHDRFSDEVSGGENFAFQLGIFALQDLKNLQIRFTELRSASGRIIPAKLLSCLNTQGINWDGLPMLKPVDVTSGKVQAMWCLIGVPKNIDAGIYEGKAIVSANGQPPREIRLSITVKDTVLADSGVSEPWKLTRLQWLNSTLAQRNDVIAPYTPLVVQKRTIRLLGRRMVLNQDGFPERIQTFFTPEMTGFSATAKEVIKQPIQLIAERDDNTAVDRKSTRLNSSHLKLSRMPSSA